MAVIGIGICIGENLLLGIGIGLISIGLIGIGLIGIGLIGIGLIGIGFFCIGGTLLLCSLSLMKNQ